MADNITDQQAYAASDVEVIYSRGDWQSWSEIAQWLQGEGANDNEFTGGEVQAMTKDFANLQEQGVEFTQDYNEAYELAQQHRQE